MIDTSTILLQDITLVYDTLDLQTIDTSKLKGLMDDVKSVVMDTPEVIVTIYPPIQLVIQLGDRRIRITQQKLAKEIGDIPLWEIAHKCHQLVSKSQLVSYGFNYDVVVMTENEPPPQKSIQDLFIIEPQRIEGLVNGDIITFIPSSLSEKSV